MKLIIRNLGIVRNAEIDLSRDFTIFCGPNSTGKTYVAYLLNAFFNSSTAWRPDIDFGDIPQFILDKSLVIRRKHLSDWCHSLEKELIRQLPSIFGISREVAQTLFANSEIKIEFSDEDFNKVIASKLKYKVYLGKNFILSFEKESDNETFSFQFSDSEDYDDKTKENYMSYMYGMIFRAALLAQNARMLTVERNSIYTFKNELSNNRIDTVDQILISDGYKAEEIVKSRSSLYPAAVRASLSVATDLVNVTTMVSDYVGLAREVESGLLSGNVTVGKEGDVRFIPSGSKENASELPIRLSSSCVKTLSGLVIYLKHLAKKGDMLIVDEPEMNLHPDNQRVLAQIFAKMINAGFRLTISTHSDYIIREVNNLLMAAELESKGEDLTSEIGCTKAELLSKERLQAYLFDFNSDGSVCACPIEIDEYGMDAVTIDAAIESQNDATVLLRDTLESYEGI